MTDNFDPKVLGGSVKRGIVNPDLAEERAKCDFDQGELRHFLFGQKLIDFIMSVDDLQVKHPEIQSGIDYYEKTREEKFHEWWRRYGVVLQSPEHKHLISEISKKDPELSYFSWTFMFPGQSPLTLNWSMFI